MRRSWLRLSVEWGRLVWSCLDVRAAESGAAGSAAGGVGGVEVAVERVGRAPFAQRLPLRLRSWNDGVHGRRAC